MMQTTKPLITYYRPQCLDDVVGHETTVAALRAQIDNPKRSHVYLFAGEPGLGKTTLAKILAKEFGANENGIKDLDAGTNGSAEEIRELMASTNYLPIGGGSKAIIFDECQAFSKTAWTALLKTLEDSADHVYFFFCTTELKKVPKAITDQRALVFELKKIPEGKIKKFVKEISDLELLNLSEEATRIIAAAAEGSPRHALNCLSKINKDTSLEDIKVLVKSNLAEDESDPTIMLARLLSNGQKDIRLLQTIIPLIENYGGVKPILKAYFQKSALSKLGSASTTIVMEMIDRLPEYPTQFDVVLLAQRFVLKG